MCNGSELCVRNNHMCRTYAAGQILRMGFWIVAEIMIGVIMLEQSEYTHVKVNNEIQFCEVRDLETKGAVEKALLANRVSYYIRWDDGGFFRARKKKCVFHVNSAQKETAMLALEGIGGEIMEKVKLL